MTIDEAIKHEEEVAKIQENNAKSYPRPDKNVKGSGKRYNAYLKCAEEHRQLAEWLKELKRYKEQAEPCEDAISRAKLIQTLDAWDHDVNAIPNYAWKVIREAPSVTPTEKVGHWIFVDEAHEHARCSECGYGNVDLLDGRPHNYCENCGAKLQEAEE